MMALVSLLRGATRFLSIWSGLSAEHQHGSLGMSTSGWSGTVNCSLGKSTRRQLENGQIASSTSTELHSSRPQTMSMIIAPFFAPVVVPCCRSCITVLRLTVFLTWPRTSTTTSTILSSPGQPMSSIEASTLLIRTQSKVPASSSEKDSTRSHSSGRRCPTEPTEQPQIMAGSPHGPCHTTS